VVGEGIAVRALSRRETPLEALFFMLTEPELDTPTSPEPADDLTATRPSNAGRRPSHPRAGPAWAPPCAGRSSSSPPGPQPRSARRRPVIPVVVVAVLNGQEQPPSDTIYGKLIHLSGYAMPLLMLAFAAQWVLPLLAAVVAGDIFAAEDQHGTWKTLLTPLGQPQPDLLGQDADRGALQPARTRRLRRQHHPLQPADHRHPALTGLSGADHRFRPRANAWSSPPGTPHRPDHRFHRPRAAAIRTDQEPALGIRRTGRPRFAMQLLGSVSGLDLTRELLLTTAVRDMARPVRAAPFHRAAHHRARGQRRLDRSLPRRGVRVLRRRDITEGWSDHASPDHPHPVVVAAGTVIVATPPRPTRRSPKPAWSKPSRHLRPLRPAVPYPRHPRDHHCHIGATTSCAQGGPKVKDEGAGPNWICMMSWTDTTTSTRTASSRSRQDRRHLRRRRPPKSSAWPPYRHHGHDVLNPVFDFDGVIKTNS